MIGLIKTKGKSQTTFHVVHDVLICGPGIQECPYTGYGCHYVCAHNKCTKGIKREDACTPSFRHRPC